MDDNDPVQMLYAFVKHHCNHGDQSHFFDMLHFLLGDIQGLSVKVKHFYQQRPCWEYVLSMKYNSLEIQRFCNVLDKYLKA